jgi:hypothetical protein
LELATQLKKSECVYGLVADQINTLARKTTIKRETERVETAEIKENVEGEVVRKRESIKNT